MTVKQGADDSTAQHSFKRFVLFARLPLSNYLIALSEAANVQAVRIGRSTTETCIVWSVGFLKALVRHDVMTLYDSREVITQPARREILTSADRIAFRTRWANSVVVSVLASRQ